MDIRNAPGTMPLLLHSRSLFATLPRFTAEYIRSRYAETTRCIGSGYHVFQTNCFNGNKLIQVCFRCGYERLVFQGPNMGILLSGGKMWLFRSLVFLFPYTWHTGDVHRGNVAGDAPLYICNCFLLFTLTGCMFTHVHTHIPRGRVV